MSQSIDPSVTSAYEVAAYLAAEQLYRGETIPIPFLQESDGLLRVTFTDGLSNPKANNNDDAIVITADNALAKAAASLLARGTGRRLFQLNGAGHLARDIAALLAEASATSVCLVLPPWNSDFADFDAPWIQLADAVDALRGRMAQFGVVMVADAQGLTRFIARRLCTTPNRQLGNLHPIAFVSPNLVDVEQTGTTILSPITKRLRSFQLLGVAAQPASLIDTAWDWIIVEGHGRSYCVGCGVLCGALRDLETDSLAGSCIQGMDCPSAGHLRIDVRRYKTRFLLIDSCEAGNTLSYTTTQQYPPLAVIALNEAAEGVVACDTILRTSLHQPREVLQALAASVTLGSFVQQLNHARWRHNVPSPYLVFGDPETPIGYSADLKAFAGLMSEADQSTNGESSLSKCPPLTTQIGHELRPRMELCGQLTTSFEAVQLAELLGVLASTGDQMRLLAARQFLTALQRVREEGWWPHQLWSERESEVMSTQERCPVCKSARAILRRYLAGPGMVRHSIECPRCRIVRDQSVDNIFIDIDVQAPECLIIGKTATVLINVGNRDPIKTVLGGVTVAIDGPDSKIRIAPSQEMLQLGPLTQCKIRFDVCSTGPSDIAHFFSLKVVAVLSGAVLWRARPITVIRG